MTTYEQIIKEGEKRGEERASRAKENLVITQGVRKGFSLEVLADLSGLSIKEVEVRIQELGLT